MLLGEAHNHHTLGRKRPSALPLIAIEGSQLPHEHLMVLAIYLTVGLSVFAHGLSAAPLADRYADWFERQPRDTARETAAGGSGAGPLLHEERRR